MKRQLDSPGRDDCDASETVSPKKTKQEDDESSEKVFNDPIHGHIELHSLLVSIIDTHQFQRLRHIKQLGGGYYVFPGASHNRFEHSLGVSYLAGEFVESLQRRQKELEITDEDVLCLKIAGLCHDLGHGPFSHLFDQKFIPSINESLTWKHEQASVDMLQYLIDDNNLWPQFESSKLTPTDLIFIKELIAGPIKPSTPLIHDSSSHNWSYQGRPRNKSFLYEIVANKRNGVDVDKWDYFARDCHCLGIPNNFDWRRYMKFARVIEVDGINQICCRDKGVVDLYEMFHTRDILHRKAYKHKTVKIVEKMITEALVEANEDFHLRGKDGKKNIKMSDAIDDMVAYTQLNDTVLQQIMMSENEELVKAKDLLKKVEQRKLYKFIGQTQLSLEFKLAVDTIKANILSSIEDCDLTEDDLYIDVVSFDYGMKDDNPIDKMNFYTKRDLNKPLKIRKEQVSQMLPQTFHEKIVRVYCKRLDKHSVQIAESCFKMWCENQGHTINPKTLDELSADDFTPYSTYTPSKKKDTYKDKAGSQVRKNLSEKFCEETEIPS